jgi:selenocysteine-specific elongation factor
VWQKEGLCITTGSVVALPSHATSHRDLLVESIDKLDKALVNQPLCHLDMDKLAQVLALQSSVTKQMQENLLRAGELVRLGESIVYRKTLQNNVRLIQHYVQENITATAAQLRDVMQISRKLAIPVLEYCDMNKYTVREGDLRRLGPRSPA